MASSGNSECHKEQVSEVSVTSSELIDTVISSVYQAITDTVTSEDDTKWLDDLLEERLDNAGVGAADSVSSAAVCAACDNVPCCTDCSDRNNSAVDHVDLPVVCAYGSSVGPVTVSADGLPMKSGEITVVPHAEPFPAVDSDIVQLRAECTRLRTIVLRERGRAAYLALQVRHGLEEVGELHRVRGMSTEFARVMAGLQTVMNSQGVYLNVGQAGVPVVLRRL